MRELTEDGVRAGAGSATDFTIVVAPDLELRARRVAQATGGRVRVDYHLALGAWAIEGGA